MIMVSLLLYNILLIKTFRIRLTTVDAEMTTRLKFVRSESLISTRSGVITPTRDTWTSLATLNRKPSHISQTFLSTSINRYTLESGITYDWSICVLNECKAISRASVLFGFPWRLKSTQSFWRSNSRLFDAYIIMFIIRNITILFTILYNAICLIIIFIIIIKCKMFITNNLHYIDI